MQKAFQQTFASLSVRNYRLYFVGQGLSQIGTWMQTIALSWLVLELTHSGTQLGFVTAVQFLPVLLFGVWGGVITDRFNKRKLLYVTQSFAGILSLILGLLILTHSVHIGMVYILAALAGFGRVIDNPSRQTFVMEMVGRDLVKNAVTLNSTLINTARIIGPSIAGIIIATAGVGPCFLVDAASYLFVLIALLLMDGTALYPAAVVERQPKQVRAGLRYAWSQPRLKATLLMMFIIGTFAYEFPVILPLFATKTLHGGASTYSFMTTAMGIGAVVGGLYTAGKGAASHARVVTAALLFGISLLAVSITPNALLVYLVLIIVGGLSVLFISQGNTTLQLDSDPQMRGRVMALWTIAFLGTTPIGGPIIGFIGDHTNPRIGVAVGGVAAILAAGMGWLLVKTKPSVQSKPTTAAATGSAGH
jgi:MFS family permease